MSATVPFVHTDTYGNRTNITSIQEFIRIAFHDLPELAEKYIEMIQQGKISFEKWLLTLTEQILEDAGVTKHFHRKRLMRYRKTILQFVSFAVKDIGTHSNIIFKDDVNLDNYYMPGTGGHTRPNYGLAGKITGKIIKYNSIDNSFNIRVDTSNDIIFNVKAYNFRGIPESDQRAGSRNKRRRKKHTKRSKRSKRSKRTKRSRR